MNVGHRSERRIFAMISNGGEESALIPTQVESGHLNHANNGAYTNQDMHKLSNDPHLVVTSLPKRLLHWGFDPSCDCWCCNKDLRYWCIIIGLLHAALTIIYSIALYLSYDPERLQKDFGTKIYVAADQRPIINYADSAFPHYIIVTLLIHISSGIAALLISMGASKLWIPFLYGHIGVTLVLEVALVWAILLTWSPYMTATYILGILLCVYFQIAAGALARHITLGYYDDCTLQAPKSLSNHKNPSSG